MSEILNDFLTEAGLNVLGSANWQSLGMAGNNDSGLFAGEGELDPMAWETPVEAVKSAVRNISELVPEAEGILVTGGGMRVLDIAESLEQEINKPVIGGDISLYWGILTRLNVKKKLSGYGRLLSNVG
jgi:maleate cis-trans isomerase